MFALLLSQDHLKIVPNFITADVTFPVATRENVRVLWQLTQSYMLQGDALCALRR